MNIERNIGIKAAALYILSGVVILLISWYMYHLRSEIKLQRAEIELQHSHFAVTNELISMVNNAQLTGSKLLATGNQSLNYELEQNILQIDSLINILTLRSYPGIQELSQINSLLIEQVRTIHLLSTLLDTENPFIPVQRRISEYIPPMRENISIISVKEDTIIKPATKKNLFRRLRDVFVPDDDSTIVVTNQRIDTLKIKMQDSLSILSEVDTISRIASREYAQNIRNIEQQMGSLLMADRTIASRISELLIQLHEQTLSSVMLAIAKSEAKVNRNYLISVAGGLTTLILMLLFIVLIIYDVNKGKQARTQLQQVLESRHQLLLSVSHDIKSPLSSLLAYLELKSSEGDDTRPMQHTIGHILAMLGNLLEYSSLEQKTLQLSISTVKVAGLGRELTEMFAPLAQAKQLTLTYHADEVNILLDEIKTRQIIINLISNAIKYTSRGEVTVNLTYHTSIFHITVSDTGAGIPNENLNDLFLPFTRVESNNSLAHGSGFGMYVVKGLTDLMGGNITVESTVGKGTRIEIKLPAQQAEAKTNDIRPKRIAVIEDDPLMFGMVSNMLRRLGHEVVNEEYEMVLTDMEMGEISGMDVLNREKDVPVVLMTGSSTINREKALQHGFAEFIRKPFLLGDLEKVFGNAIITEEDSFLSAIDEEVMQLFRDTTYENQQKLKQALAAKDFTTAQSISHKMLPMMAQLGLSTEALLRMDASRNNVYDNWQNDVKEILEINV